MDNEVGSSYLQNISKERVNIILQSIKNEDKARAVFDSDTGKFYIAYSDGEGDNDKILLFDFVQQAFSRYVDVYINDFCKLTDGRLLMASDGHILKWEDDYHDISGEEEKIIKMEVETPIYTFGNPLRNKVVSWIFVVFRNYGSNHRLNFELIVDNELKKKFEAYGDNTDREYLSLRYKTTYKGRDFKLRIINDQYSPAEIYAIGFIWKVGETGGEII